MLKSGEGLLPGTTIYISSSSVGRFSESTSMNKMQKLSDLVVTLHIAICIFLSLANLFVFLDTEINELCQTPIMFSVTETVKYSLRNMNRIPLNCYKDCEKNHLH